MVQRRYLSYVGKVRYVRSHFGAVPSRGDANSASFKSEQSRIEIVQEGSIARPL